jgi:hypothetical protein
LGAGIEGGSMRAISAVFAKCPMAVKQKTADRATCAACRCPIPSQVAAAKPPASNRTMSAIFFNPLIHGEAESMVMQNFCPGDRGRRVYLLRSMGVFAVATELPVPVLWWFIGCPFRAVSRFRGKSTFALGSSRPRLPGTHRLKRGLWHPTEVECFSSNEDPRTAKPVYRIADRAGRVAASNLGSKMHGEGWRSRYNYEPGNQPDTGDTDAGHNQ